jgi:Mn-dependent DtxR family transcriptional regulator
MALVGALGLALNATVGFTNRSLYAQVAGLLGEPYTASQMTYDLRRLRRKGLIQRLPHRQTYVLTSQGIRVAVFYTKTHGRILGPLLAADRPPAPADPRRALHVIDDRVTDYVNSARLCIAA